MKRNGGGKTHKNPYGHADGNMMGIALKSLYFFDERGLLVSEGPDD